jgi:hypothetical protein
VNVEIAGIVDPHRGPGFDDNRQISNKVVGHAVGMTSGVYQRTSDDHLIVTYNADYELPGGTLRVEAITARNGIFTGKLLGIPRKSDTR